MSIHTELLVSETDKECLLFLLFTLCLEIRNFRLFLVYFGIKNSTTHIV